MTEIADSLRVLYETPLEDRGDEYVFTVPTELVENGSLTDEDVYRVALLEAASGDQQSTTEPAEQTTRDLEPDADRRGESEGPPVEAGDERSVTIDTLGDQGDGIAKVDRGFIVIVPGTQPGDRVDVEITNVNDSVAFAEPVRRAEVR